MREMLPTSFGALGIFIKILCDEKEDAGFETAANSTVPALANTFNTKDLEIGEGLTLKSL